MTLGAGLVALIKGTSHLTDTLLPTGGSRALCQVDAEAHLDSAPPRATHWSSSDDGRGFQGQRRGDWLPGRLSKHYSLCWRGASWGSRESGEPERSMGRRSTRISGATVRHSWITLISRLGLQVVEIISKLCGVGSDNSWGFHCNLVVNYDLRCITGNVYDFIQQGLASKIISDDMHASVHVPGQIVACTLCYIVIFAFYACLEEHMYDFPKCWVCLYVSIMTWKRGKENHFYPKHLLKQQGGRRNCRLNNKQSRTNALSLKCQAFCVVLN